MPTVYTSDIYNGKEMSGKDFIIQCARAFGACITMRDEPNDAVIPEAFEPSTYHIERIERAKAELEKYQQMTIGEIQEEIDKEYQENISYNKNKIKERIEMRNRYNKTLSEVEKWNPPTSEHINLKSFAIKQLKESIDFDCGTSYYEEEVNKESPEVWRNNKIAQCYRDIAYHTKENDAEVKRVNERNAWIKDLRNSFR